MPAGPARKARRRAATDAAAPIEIPSEILALAMKLSRRFAARYGKTPHMDHDDYHQDAVVRWLQHSRANPDAGSPAVAAVVMWRAMVVARSRRLLKYQAADAAALIREHTVSTASPIGDDERRDLDAAIDNLNPRSALIVRRRYYHGDTGPEVARLCGLSEARVDQIARQAKALLRDRLGPEYLELWGRAIPLRNPEAWHVTARRIGRKGTPGPGGGTRSGKRTTQGRLAILAHANELRDDLA